jgi:hypothetical protein
VKTFSDHAKSTDFIFRTLDKNIHLTTLPLRRFPHLYSTCKVVGVTRVISHIFFFSHYFSVSDVTHLSVMLSHWLDISCPLCRVTSLVVRSRH